MSPLDLRVASSAADFDGLQAAWSGLHDRSGASVFQSYEWQRTWWKHLGENDPARQLHIVVLAEGGEVVAIAPFVVEAISIAPLTRLRRLAFLGTGLTDALDVLVRDGFEAGSCERLAEHLADAAGFDALWLTDVPDESRTRAPLFEALRRHGFEGKAFVAEQSPRTILKSTWKETLQSFEGPTRRKLGWRRRHLEAEFAVELEVDGPEERLAADVDEYMHMHQERWTSLGRKGIYADEAVAAFQREIAMSFFRRGWLFLPFLRVGGARLVTFCAYRYRDRLCVYLTGMRDPGPAGKFAPGIVLHSLCMEHLIPRGVRVYDFLRGIEPYKYECGAVDVPVWALMMFRRRALVSRAKNAIALLEASLARRAEQEWLAVQRLRSRHGLFSSEVARYLRGRMSATLRDGLRKLRSPEKSLTAPR
jgi:CelD/BcsL family acetyltransferase involved in cellulose biosynthesis